MIGQAYAPGRGFKGLARYLRDGHLGEERPERVAWMETRNLPTQNPEVAACFMAATSRRSVRTQNPVFHFSLSFDHSDAVNRELMRRVADRTLRDLELEGYQVLIVAHRDRAHPHMHFMVNRVHPERGTAWSDSFSKVRIEKTLRAQEVELGLRVVPGKLAPVPGRERERAAPRLVSGGPEFVARVQRDAGPVMLNATSWAEVERGLAAHGLSVRVRGGGLVVTDGKELVKASQIDSAVSRRHMERRLGALGDYRARQAVAERTLQERAARAEPATTPAPALPPQQPEPQPEAAPQVQLEPQRHAEPAASPEPTQPPVQPRPALPPEQLALPLETHREAPPQPRQIQFALPLEPEVRRGVPRSTPAPARAPESTRAPEPEPSPAPEPTPPPPVPQRPGPAVPPPPQPTRAPERPKPQNYGEVVREYYRATRALFADPPAARWAFMDAVDRDGLASAVHALGQRPEGFGALRPGATPELAARAADAGHAYAPKQGEGLRPAVREAARWIREAEAAQQAQDELHRTLDATDAAKRELADLKRLRTEGLGGVKELKAAGADVYADPARAMEAIEEHCRKFGGPETARVVLESPERFGALQQDKAFGWKRRVPGFHNEDRARYDARYLAGLLRNTGWVYGAPTEAQVDQAAARLKTAKETSDAARAVRERFRDVHVPTHLREAVSRLRALHVSAPKQTGWIERKVRSMVPRSAVGLVRSTLEMARAIDPDRQREQGLDRGMGL